MFIYSIIKTKNFIDEQKISDAQALLDECQINLSNVIQNINVDEDNDKILKINSKNEDIKKLQETYANSYSKNHYDMLSIVKLVSSASRGAVTT